MKEQIVSLLHAECPWRDTLHWYPTIDSTNTQAKRLASEGAPHGTAVIASAQTQGRGRLGRSFHSPANAGLYLSVILRPNCKPEQLLHLTCVAAVAACDAIRQVCPLQPKIKWINDLTCDNKKLGGILTELSCDPTTGLVNYAIIGIGINCSQTQQDFPDDIREIATSIYASSAQSVSPAALAAALIEHLAAAAETFIVEKSAWMEKYRKNCITLGKQVKVLQGESSRVAEALDIDSNGALLVRYEDGNTAYIQAGEVSVRGLYAYT